MPASPWSIRGHSTLDLCRRSESGRPRWCLAYSHRGRASTSLSAVHHPPALEQTSPLLTQTLSSSALTAFQAVPTGSQLCFHFSLVIHGRTCCTPVPGQMSQSVPCSCPRLLALSFNSCLQTQPGLSPLLELLTGPLLQRVHVGHSLH